MTSSDFRNWLTTLSDACATLPAAEVLARLPKAAEQEVEVPNRNQHDIELTWRERLWLVPAETRLGVAELCEALNRSSSWAYRRTGNSEDPLPHRLLDGQLVFIAGEIRHWIRTHEESIHECPMDSTPGERTLKVVEA